MYTYKELVTYRCKSLALFEQAQFALVVTIFLFMASGCREARRLCVGDRYRWQIRYVDVNLCMDVWLFYMSDWARWMYTCSTCNACMYAMYVCMHLYDWARWSRMYVVRVMRVWMPCMYAYILYDCARACHYVCMYAMYVYKYFVLQQLKVCLELLLKKRSKHIHTYTAGRCVVLQLKKATGSRWDYLLKSEDVPPDLTITEKWVYAYTHDITNNKLVMANNKLVMNIAHGNHAYTQETWTCVTSMTYLYDLYCRIIYFVVYMW